MTFRLIVFFKRNKNISLLLKFLNFLRTRINNATLQDENKRDPI